MLSATAILSCNNNKTQKNDPKKACHIRGFLMGVDKIVKLVGVLVAVVAAFVAIPYSGLLVALLGIAGAWFIADEDRSRFLIPGS
jgi:hypothetical protein